MTALPQKKFYRQRAHANPIADHSMPYPCSPNSVDWSEYYSTGVGDVLHVDVGCGYGGLLVALSPLFPDERILGLEIRVKVSDYVVDRIKALRQLELGKFGNIACIRTNAMKYLPNYFKKGQLKSMFFLYPDPHFKKSKHKWRIINDCLLAEYAYVLREGGVVYTITDVEEVHEWMDSHFSAHVLFERIPDSDLKADSVVGLLYDSTEEGKKVTRAGGEKFLAVFRRLPNPTI